MSRRALVLLAVAALVGGACAGSGRTAQEGGGSPAAGAFPVTVAAANGDVTIGARPERIVSMSATATEILFAIGAGEQVAAVDSTSNFPPEAPTTDLSAFEPNAEAIAAMDPDLVVLSDDINEIVRSLEALEIPTILQTAAADLSDTYAQIEQLGKATGQVEGAEELVDDMKGEISTLLAEVPDFQHPPTYYHELDQTLYSVTSDTFIGQLYALVGLANIADRAKGGSGYPQLSAEYIIEADPDLVFLADTKCCGVTARDVAERPGWDQITAVRMGTVVEVDDDVASRWGPRVVDFLRIMVRAASELGQA